MHLPIHVSPMPENTHIHIYISGPHIPYTHTERKTFKTVSGVVVPRKGCKTGFKVNNFKTFKSFSKRDGSWIVT